MLKQCLDGKWAFLVDPYESGYLDYRSKERPLGLFADRDWRRTRDLVEYDFDRAPTLRVPGDWNSQRPELRYYEESVWYRRIFEARIPRGRRAFLRFDAVSYACMVFLNGSRLGSHEGGFTPFQFEVTGLLRPGRNSLVLKVDARRKLDGIPAMQTDWWNYGGIIRSVWLLEKPAVFLDEVSVGLDKAGSISGWVRLDGGRGGEEVRVSIPGLCEQVKARAGRQGLARFAFQALPQPWSPESPRRYRVAVDCGGDHWEDQVGFRTVETRGADILLNGKPVFLKGISLHDEALGPRGGRLGSAAQARALLLRARELGCNFVRLAHYPHAEFTVREAERLGLMVWSEIPVYWSIQWAKPAVRRRALDQLGAMIRRDRNRAAVIVWSVGNETPVGAARNRFMQALVRQARRADPSRLISAALEQQGGSRRSVNDPLGASLDVLGLNEYIGWYDGAPAKCRTLSWKFAWNKPLVVSEFGADAKQGLHGPASKRWTEEYQDLVYREQIAMLSKIPNLRGMTPWILKDFRSPRRWLTGIQDGWNRKGLISEGGIPKRAFKTLQQFYRQLI